MKKILFLFPLAVLLAAGCNPFYHNPSEPPSNYCDPGPCPNGQIPTGQSSSSQSTTNNIQSQPTNSQPSQPKAAKNVCLNRYLKYQVELPQGWSVIENGIIPEKISCEEISQRQQEFDAKLAPDQTITNRGSDPVTFRPDNISDQSYFTIGVCDSRCIGYPNKPTPSTNLKVDLQNNLETIVKATTLSGQPAYWSTDSQGQYSISANYKGSFYQIQFSKNMSEDIRLQVANSFLFLP